MKSNTQNKVRNLNHDIRIHDDAEKILSHMYISNNTIMQFCMAGVQYGVLSSVEDYSVALLFYQKALAIQENVQCNPLECATIYVNLSETYLEMKDYTMALTYFQKGLEICEKKLLKNHHRLAARYHKMAKFYLATEQYTLAMKYIRQALEITEEKLPENIGKSF